MKTKVCFYFQVHQPFRIKTNYSFFDMWLGKEFIDEESNSRIMKKVAQNCYLKTNTLLLNLINKYPQQMNICFSLSGTAIEQMELYSWETLESFKALARTGQVEFLAETYYHSLASIHSKDEFNYQVKKHQDKINEVFNYTPTIFRNTELIYNNQIARMAYQNGFKGILADGIDRVLKHYSPNFTYSPKNLQDMGLLFKNYRLSDDIAFRYKVMLKDNQNLLLEKTLKLSNKGAKFIGLFLDYETFGEHHHEETKIFAFLKNTLELIIKSPQLELSTPSDIINSNKNYGEFDIKETISWADQERDLSAWQGNPMQNSQIKELYSLEKNLKSLGNPALLRKWRLLTTSDHSYYTCLKHFSDEAVHNYFSPFPSPHDAYIAYSNALNNLKYEVDSLLC